jgi:hypothetical protein
MVFYKKKKNITFIDSLERKIIWYARDYNNIFKQHHDHQEYRDLEGINETLNNPDRINKPRRGVDQDRLIYYKDRGNFLTAKWHQVIIRNPKKWENQYSKPAILITTLYLESININEKQIWP